MEERLNPIVIGVIVFLTLNISLVNASTVLGVSPEEQVQFQGVNFICKQSKEQIPISAVNDDFCDCQDGSDEPGTSACSSILHFTQTGFYCANKGFKSQYIPLSFVNDGVCDCCDGSDESNGPNPCENTCKQAGQLELIQIKRDIYVHEKGALKKAEMIETAKGKLPTVQKEYETLAKKLEEAEEELQALENKQEQLKTLRQEHEDLFDDDSDDYIREDEEVGDDKLEKHERRTNPERLQLQADFQTKHGVSTSDVRSQLEDLKKEIRNKKRETGDLRDDMDKSKTILDTDFGPDNVFFALYGTKFEVTHGEYKYSLKPFETVHQSTTLVGNWAGWEDGFSKMKFDNGARCWGHGPRACTVDVACGYENSIMNVEEPNPCFYTFTFYTPAACSAEHAAALRKTLDGNLHFDDVDDLPKTRSGWFF